MDLDLTQAKVAQLAGYQLAFQDEKEGTQFRGQIARMEVTGEDDELRLIVSFVWLAKLGDPTWELTDPQQREWFLGLYVASDKGNGKIVLTSKLMDELVVLCPPGDSTLELNRVRDPNHVYDPTLAA